MSLAVINVFTPKPERFEDFIAAQQATVPGMRARVDGLLGGRFYRSKDGRTAVLVSHFASEAQFQAFRDSAAFAAQRERIGPMLEKADPGFYELVFET